jgi:hypothetical protein
MRCPFVIALVNGVLRNFHSIQGVSPVNTAQAATETVAGGV